MGLGASKPTARHRNNTTAMYTVKASRTACRYSSNDGTWICNTVKLDPSPQNAGRALNNATANAAPKPARARRGTTKKTKKGKK